MAGILQSYTEDAGDYFKGLLKNNYEHPNRFAGGLDYLSTFTTENTPTCSAKPTAVPS
jgi:hypothetical protein